MATILTIPQAKKQAIQNFRSEMSQHEKNMMLREAIFSAMDASVGLPLDKKPVSLGQPINPHVNHFRRALKNPSLLTQPDSTSVSELHNPLVEQRSPPSTPVGQIAQPLVKPPGAPKKPMNGLHTPHIPSFKKKPAISSDSSFHVGNVGPRETAAIFDTEVKPALSKDTESIHQPVRLIQDDVTSSTPKKKQPFVVKEDIEEDIHPDNEEEEIPKKADKKKRTFEIDPSELSGVGGSFPVNNVSSKFFKGLFDNGELKENNDLPSEEDDAEAMESAMISEVGSAIVSPDSSDDEIDYDDKGAVQDDGDVEELNDVNKETKQVKRKKEETKQARKAVKPETFKKTNKAASSSSVPQEEAYKMPSEQDTATALLLETERCMVPNLAQINMILAKKNAPVFNIQHKRLVSVWMSMFASDWYCRDNDNRNIFHRLLNTLVSGWVVKSNVFPSYNRINYLVDQLRSAPCCSIEMKSKLDLSPSVQCYISDIKATKENINDFFRVYLSLQTKEGEPCKDIVFYCLNKYKKLITALYFSLHASSWVCMRSSSDADVQENVENNKATFHKYCVETLQTFLAYKEKL